MPEDRLPASTKKFLISNNASFTAIIALGQGATISQTVLSAASASLH